MDMRTEQLLQSRRNFLLPSNQITLEARDE